MADILYIVVPCYNEEAVLPETARRLRDKLEALMAADKISEKSRVLFVNDGSRDSTWRIIQQLHKENPLFSGVDLSHNRGHQNALLAGLMTAADRCDMAISMDADLQDDVDAVNAMVEQYENGCDIVYGVRSSRQKDTFFKRFTAEAFYRLMNRLGAETVFNHADYQLVSRQALEGLSQFHEVNLFLRGIVPMIGYRTGTVEYERGQRFAGESKYPLKKMLSFAMEGITSLSVKPLHMITGLGFLVFLVSVAVLIYSMIRWTMGDTILGWASVICSVWAIGGLILLSLGVIGEYIGKTYLETKGRPRFLIREVLEDRYLAQRSPLKLPSSMSSNPSGTKEGFTSSSGVGISLAEEEKPKLTPPFKLSFIIFSVPARNSGNAAKAAERASAPNSATRATVLRILTVVRPAVRAFFFRNVRLMAFRQARRISWGTSASGSSRRARFSCRACLP